MIVKGIKSKSHQRKCNQTNTYLCRLEISKWLAIDFQANNLLAKFNEMHFQGNFSSSK